MAGHPAWRVVLFVALLASLCVTAAHASAETDAERIARARDLAEQSQAASADGLSADEQDDAVSANGSAAYLSPNENLPLGGQGESGGLSLFGGGGDSGPVNADGSSWMFNTLAALGIVIGLVFAIRWVLRRGGVVTSAAPRGSVVEVLSRTTVAPRSHVVLMRVGQRILIVNDSPNGMRTLATVDDSQEVAELLGAIDASSPTSLSSGFQGTMSKLTAEWSQRTGQAEADASSHEDLDIDRTRGALSSLRSRVALMSKAGGGS